MGEAKRKATQPLPRWTPFQRGYLPSLTEAEMMEKAIALGVTLEEVKRAMSSEARNAVAVWINSRYQVNVYDVPDQGFPAMWWLSIKRLDKHPMGIERFRDFQRIKNEIVGPEHEAVELYPAESRLVDTANQYHLWVIQEPGVRFPFGMGDRKVDGRSAGGAVQHPFEDA